MGSFNPWFITGLTDAEGTVSVRVNQTSRLRWRVALAFQIGLHIDDLGVLEYIKKNLSAACYLIFLCNALQLFIKFL